MAASSATEAMDEYTCAPYLEKILDWDHLGAVKPK
jgi:hypothetical protein